MLQQTSNSNSPRLLFHIPVFTLFITLLQPVSLLISSSPLPYFSLYSNDLPLATRRLVASQQTLISKRGVEERRDGNDNIRRAKKRALEVIAAAVQDEEVYNECRHEETHGLK
jgi:hypothetical protein